MKRLCISLFQLCGLGHAKLSTKLHFFIFFKFKFLQQILNAQNTW